MSVRMSRSSPSIGSRQSPGSDWPSSGQGLGLSWQKRAKSAASALGRMARLPCTKPGAMPEVGARLVPARMRRRASRPGSPFRLVIEVSIALLLSTRAGLHVLAAVDLDLGAAHMACALLAQAVDQVGAFVGPASPT